jgi:N-acetylglucosaminyldiphosphoundecaprenol N-acetyl-beta-D-mannosaminyltransferase
VTAAQLPTVTVAGIEVVDAPMRRIVHTLAAHVTEPVLAFALHVGGLNVATDPIAIRAYGASDLTYADGAAVVLLARLAGATAIQRAPTTDLAPMLLTARRARGQVRLFLIGGRAGLAEAAGKRLTQDVGVTVVGTMPGFDIGRQEFLSGLRSTRPDVVVVGLGAPREMAFLADLRPELPPAVYLTCGGWFGFLVGEETRAPALLRRCGLEWVWRVKQHPRRLAGRYALGLSTTVRLAVGLLIRRVSGASR